jgi:phospholipase/carboxylesterase
MQVIHEKNLIGLVPDNAKATLVMLHGYGDNAEGFSHLARHIAAAVPGLAVFSANAPYENEQPEIAVFGGRQWFSLSDFWANGFHRGMFEGGIAKTFPYVKESILQASGLAKTPPEKTIVLGFSQGAMVALAYGLISGEKTNGIISISGLGDFAPDKIISRAKVLSIHGTADDTVPIIAQEALKQTLVGASVPAEFVAVPNVGHNDILSDSIIAKIAEFIKKLT